MSTAYTTEIFTEKAQEIHGDRYDYSEVNYINATHKVNINCNIHGQFEQSPSDHITRGRNCPKCGYLQRSKSRKQNNNWWTYTKSKIFVHNLKLNNIREWVEYCKSTDRPDSLSSNPKITFSTEWEGWESWIGTNGRKKEFVSYARSIEITHNFNLKSYEDWIHFCQLGNRPENIPFFPKQVYSNDWISWGKWLGYKSRANGNLSGVIYVLQYNDTPNNVYKIGRTYRLDKRSYEHQRIANNIITVISTFGVNNMNIAETTAHKIALSLGNKYQYRRSKEHFQIDDIDTLLQRFTEEL